MLSMLSIDQLYIEVCVNFSDVKRLTLDVIASTVFSYDTDVFNEENNIFLQKLIELFKNFDLKQISPILKSKVMFASKYIRWYWLSNRSQM